MIVKNFFRFFLTLFFPKKLRARILKLWRSNSRAVLRYDKHLYYQALLNANQLFLRSDISIDKACAPLHMAFAKRNVRSELLGNDWWAEFVKAASTLDKEGKEFQTGLVRSIENIENDRLEPWEWLHIYALALTVGLLVVGHSLRQKAIETALAYSVQKKPLPYYKFRALLASLLESGHHDEFQNTLRLYPHKFKRTRKLFLHVYNILNADRKEENDYLRLLKADKAFYALIKGKKIAIVGPAKTKFADAAEIDAYDIVVRCNYKEKGIGVDPKIKGMRCDISYFNFEQTRHFKNQKTVNWPENISWVVCKSKKSSKDFRKKIYSLPKTANSPSAAKKNFQIRFLTSLRETLIITTPNAVANIAMDLLRFEPAEIKIFHADMMLTVEREAGYYPESWNRENNMEKTFLLACAGSHEPVIQYWLLMTLFNNGKIKGDKRFEEVMKIGLKEYMAQLQNIYGYAGRTLQ